MASEVVHGFDVLYDEPVIGKKNNNKKKIFESSTFCIPSSPQKRKIMKKLVGTVFLGVN